MEFEKAIGILEKGRSQLTNKGHIRAYTQFIKVLEGLQEKDLPQSTLNSIAKELDGIGLTSSDVLNKHFLSKKLWKFKNFLNAKHKLTPEGYYSSLGVGVGTALGTSLGISVGVVFDRENGIALGIPFGISLGIIFGIIAGNYMDARAKKEGRSFSEK